MAEHVFVNKKRHTVLSDEQPTKINSQKSLPRMTRISQCLHHWWGMHSM